MISSLVLLHLSEPFLQNHYNVKRFSWRGDFHTAVIQVFLDEQTCQVTNYDEGLTRKLIEKITVYDDHLVFEFRSSIETEVQM